ncbi:MAG: valine--tRNA ligase [Leptospirales bacterium]|nr:valine--tRNA ligase [Leptospirales bacterium]
MAHELSSRYEHQKTEERWYRIWEDAQAFRPERLADHRSRNAASFVIVIPPPNVTGELHVGHALDQTIQDVLVRAARKRGRDCVWIPGVDHAGIATQVRVEKNLAAEGLNRHQLGRKKFIERVWEWKHASGGAIARQQRRMGFSLDWSRERFTMDEGLSHAVRKVFVDLYREGLIYRDTRMVNWDPVSHTVLSDLEVEYDETYRGELYEFAYPLSAAAQQAAGKHGAKEIVVATTRPETMLGDTAIAVHPEDKRYKKWIGKTVQHPFLEREIPIIADAQLVDPEFGTGAVKVTPAHDPNDYETGKRHDLQFINIFDESARINANGGRFCGLDRYEARKQVKQALADLGLERGSREHVMAVGKSQRTAVVVEPIISTQWYVKVAPLATRGIEAVESGEIRFVPKLWENTYFHWMREIRDWCISRQLWWGHQIPAWHCAKCSQVTVDYEDPAACAHCGSSEIERDADVLDTWFSSALWPFSTMGWPDRTDDLERYYPTTVLVTAYDIIFFWVARMIMMGLHFMKAPPFRDIYIHGLMRDENGRKMSKTIGNVVDPLKVIETTGADAFRFFLIGTLSEGKDTNYNEAKLKTYQNFANKIWNSSRFVLMNLPDDFRAAPEGPYGQALEAEDCWILFELQRVSAECARVLDEYRFHIYAEELYSFAWNSFCDWYIEFIKPRLFGKGAPASAEAARQTSFYVLRSLLGLLHPAMPFITEEIYDHLKRFFAPANDAETLLITAPWPMPPELPPQMRRPAQALRLLQEVIGGVRQIRGDMSIAPDAKVPIIVQTDNQDLADAVLEKSAAIERLARASEIRAVHNYEAARDDAMAAFSEGQVFVPLAGVLDLDKERARLQNERNKIEKSKQSTAAKLSNEAFLSKAAVEVVEKEKLKLAEMEEKLAAIAAALARLGG